MDLTAAPVRLGGAGHYMVELVSALSRSGQVALDLLVRPVHLPLLELRAPAARLHRGASDRRPLRLVWEQTGLPWRLRGIAPDVVHSPHYTMPLASPAPVVVTFHDPTFFTHPELHEGPKAPFFRTAMRVAARRAARIVVVSEATRRGVLDHTQADPGKVDVVYEGVHPEEFHVPSAPELEQFCERHRLERPWVAFLGTIEPRKNVPRLVEAFARIAGEWDGKLVLAGDTGWGREAVEAALAAAPAGRVRRLGYLPDEDRRCLLGGADVVCYPSIAEGFGLPVIEAMACGAPVLTSRVSALAEVAGEAAELVDPLDVGSIAAALGGLLGDAGRRQELVAAGRERAAGFTWEAAAAAMVDVYRKALS